MKATGIPAAELAARREALLEHIRSHDLTGYVLFGEDYIQYFTSFGFLATERPVAFACHTAGEHGRLRPRVRGRASARRDRVRAGRVLPRVPRDGASDAASWPACSRTWGSPAPSAPTRTAIRASSATKAPPLSDVTGRPVLPLAPFIESMMVRKSEAEVALIRESARWCEHAHRLLQEYTRPGSDGGRGEPARGPRGHARHARDARRRVRRPAGVLRRRLGRVPRPDRAQELVGARGRAQHRVPGRRRARHGDERPDLGLQRRARARDDHRPPDRRDAPPLRPHGRRAAGRPSTRSGPASRAPTSTTPCSPTSRRTTCCRTGGSTSATRSGCATTRRRSSTPATTRWSSRAWSSRSSPASTRARSAASATPTPSSSPRTGSTSSPRIPSDIESLTIAV